MRFIAALAFSCALLGTTAPEATTGRHLRYAFTAYSLMGTTPDAASKLSGPGSATMDVDFLGSGPKGGTLIRATESWWHELRPEQSVTCEVDPGGSLICDQYPVASFVEFVLFPMLAANYFSGIPESKWQLHYTITLPPNYYGFSSTVDLHVLHSSGSMVEIVSDGTTQAIGGPLERQHEHGSVTFDRTSSLPVAIHEEWTPSMLYEEEPVGVDFRLVTP